MAWLDWYNALDKPGWTPAPATIGTIWQILYPIIAVSFLFVFVQAFRVVWGTIVWMMVAVWRHYRWVAVAQVPYFVWVSIATTLQLSINWMNWRR
jgi:tryptophan-rich sensory protein